jgi:putative sigma-54 modulation protein
VVYNGWDEYVRRSQEEVHMEIMIKSRSGKATEAERTYIESKIRKLNRYLDDINTVHLDLSRAQLRGSGEVQIVQATLHGERGMLIRAEERDQDFNAAVDRLHDSLQRQLTRYKDRRYRRGKGVRASGDAGMRVDMETSAESSNGHTPHLVKTKQFVYKPMDSEEAIEQMELLGHDFFVFTDANTNLVNVIYRRNDGNYGLIEQDAT